MPTESVIERGESRGESHCFIVWPGKTSLRRWHLIYDLDKQKKQSLDPWARGIKAEGKASINPEMGTSSMCLRNRRRPGLVGRVSKGKKGEWGAVE